MLFILSSKIRIIIQNSNLLDKPLVSVICLCYNHVKYVEQAIASVLHQSYGNVELIVVDDASEDDSQEIIKKASELHGFQLLFNEENQGNCKSFNRGFRQSKGKYLIDLAADDLLESDRIKIGVTSLEEKGSSYGVHFCDVQLMDKNGNQLGTHYKRDGHGKLLDFVPSGDIYIDLVERYLISAPSMMMSRKALEELGGYDEALSYEDFDFWVRSSRNYKYSFTDQALVKKIILNNSLSSIQYQRKNKHTLSTAMVCQKALALNKTDDENKALLKRINYELKWALITENWEASSMFIELKKKLSKKSSLRLLAEQAVMMIKPKWFWLWEKICN